MERFLKETLRDIEAKRRIQKTKKRELRFAQKHTSVHFDEEKRRKVHDFAGHLYEEGGQAVNMLTKLFGKETPERVILQHMYGV